MITIAYLTNRIEPKWEWFIDSLANQVPLTERSQVELLFIDGNAWFETSYIAKYDKIGVSLEGYANATRYKQLISTVDSKFDFVHIPPKPTVWQGPFRLTTQDYFAASNARNTAIIAAKGDYLVCVDDLSVLLPGWYDQVKHAALYQYVVAGSYRKVKDLVVTNGIITSFTDHPIGLDSRWGYGSDLGIVPCGGHLLFGCSFGIPLELALAVNGFDEQCDSQGAEDYDFGIRVGRTGAKIYYNRNMCTYEDEDLHYTNAPLKRIAKPVKAENLPSDYTQNNMSDHVMINLLGRDRTRITTLGTPNLRELRKQYQETGTVPIPTEPSKDWRDDIPLSSM